MERRSDFHHTSPTKDMFKSIATSQDPRSLQSEFLIQTVGKSMDISESRWFDVSPPIPLSRSSDESQRIHPRCKGHFRSS